MGMVSSFVLWVALAAAGSNPEARKLAASAEAAMRADNFAGAAVLYRALLEQRPLDAEARFALGVCYTEREFSASLRSGAGNLMSTIGLCFFN